MPAGCGAFGKIPAMGDFLRANLPPGFAEAWDGWLQRTLTAARADLGGRWLDCYLSAPIWRFTLGAGLAGRLPVIGVMMASVDRVGRHFPLTLVAPLPQGSSALAVHFGAEAAFLRLEDIALAALEADLPRDGLLRHLQALETLRLPAPARLSGRGDGLALRTAAGQPAACGLAAALLEGQVAHPSLWTAEMAEGSRVLLCDGLPPQSRAAALFDPGAAAWPAAAPP